MKPPLLLLIEPDAGSLEQATEYLRQDCGSRFEVKAASSTNQAEEVLERAETEDRSLALLVVRQTGEDEIEEFIRSVKRRFPETKVVLYDESVDPDEANDSMREGLADCSIADPWTAPEVSFEPILRDLLRHWETSSASGTVLVIGDQWAPRCHDVKDLLARHRIAYRWIDVESDEASEAELTSEERAGLPVLRFPDGSNLLNPDDEALAEKLGFSTEPELPFYDLVIVGGGPAGLTAGVYAASEGLRTVIVEIDAPGGQAGTSALIENYLGFPDGISGAELASRAARQAAKFGAEILLTHRVTALRAEGEYRSVNLDNGSEIAAHCVLLAIGVRYRKLDVPGAEELSGSGVYYGTPSAEASRFRDEDISLLGGGNSAGQAALLLARYAKNVRMITTDESFEATMSKYLLERIKATPEIELVSGAEVVEVHGEEKLEAITVRRGDRKPERIETKALFIWIGASPETDWLGEGIARDKEGFVLTGRDLNKKHLAGWAAGVYPFHLETCIPGVYAAGDVRHGSVKRVGSAVGEGAMAVQFIHEYLRGK